jgi:hypothetical protein
MKSDPLQEKHPTILNKSKTIAKSLANRNLPAPEGDNILSHVSPITAGYSNLISTYVKRRNTGNKHLVQLERDSYTSKQTRLQERLRNLNDQLRRFNLEQEEQ